MKSLLKVCLFAMMLAPAGFAETRLILQIPFEFVAGGKKLPAGEYRFSTTSENGLVMLHGTGGAAALLTSPGSPVRSDASLSATFEKHGDDNYLSEIVLDGVVTRVVHVKPGLETVNR